MNKVLHYIPLLYQVRYHIPMEKDKRDYLRNQAHEEKRKNHGLDKGCSELGEGWSC